MSVRVLVSVYQKALKDGITFYHRETKIAYFLAFG